MSNKADSTQREFALRYISIARQRWEKSGVKYPDYLSDRDAFYKSVKQQVLPEFVKAGGVEKIFLKAVIEYAREDWIRTGYDEKEFDQKFKAAKRRAKLKWLWGIIGGLFILIFKSIHEAFWGVMGDRWDRDDTWDYVVLYILAFTVITAVATSVDWVRKGLISQSDEITTLKLD